MFSQTILDFGRKPNVIRDLSAYAGRRKAEIGAEHVFDFSIGSPNVPPPPQVHEAMLDLLTHADPVEIHSYTAAPGLLSLRKTIAQSINRRFGDHVDESGIYVTAGASGAIAMALKGLTNPGDEVIIFTPHYMEYLIYTEAYGAKPVIVKTLPDSFQIDLPAFEAALTEKTRVVILNSPNNPSGVIYTKESLQALTDAMKAAEKRFGHAIYLLSDKPYRELSYDGVEVPYLMNDYDDTLVCYSYSKTLSIPGERMGYLAICRRCADYADVVDVCAGAARALGHICASNLYQRVIERCVDVVADVNFYKENRDIQSFFKAANAFYLSHSQLWEEDFSWEGFQWICADDNQNNCISFLRRNKAGDFLLTVCNFSPVERQGYRLGAPVAGQYERVFSSDDPAFGGQGLGSAGMVKSEYVESHGMEQSLVLDLPPMSAMIYRCARKFPPRRKAAAAKAPVKKAPAKKKQRP